MRSKQVVNTQRASAANKPFVTEYRLSYRDPTVSIQKRNVTSKKHGNTSNQPVEPVKESSSTLAPKAEEKPADVVPLHSTSLTLPAMMSGVEKANVSIEAYRQRRRKLATEHKKGLHQRYNIITGSAIEGEPYSGFKEGRRAVIKTCQHIDSITNARSPGYNIVTGHDALIGKSPEEIQKIYGQGHVPKAHAAHGAHGK